MSLIDEYAESTLAQRISMVSGVAQVNIFGAAKYAVRVDVDPRQLAAHGIGIDEVADAISNSNVNLPTGTIYGADKTFVVQANGQLMKASAYAPIDHRVPERQPGPPRRRRARLRRHRERQERGLVQRRAHDISCDPEAAGHQRGRRGAMR